MVVEVVLKVLVVVAWLMVEGMMLVVVWGGRGRGGLGGAGKCVLTFSV